MGMLFPRITLQHCVYQMALISGLINEVMLNKWKEWPILFLKVLKISGLKLEAV